MTSLRKWYYFFRLCFSFSSGYDFTVIKSRHILNCYPFLKKFLLKTQIYKLVVGNCGRSIYYQSNKFVKSSLLFGTYILIKKVNQLNKRKSCMSVSKYLPILHRESEFTTYFFRWLFYPAFPSLSTVLLSSYSYHCSFATEIIKTHKWT